MVGGFWSPFQPGLTSFTIFPQNPVVGYLWGTLGVVWSLSLPSSSLSSQPCWDNSPSHSGVMEPQLHWCSRNSGNWSWRRWKRQTWALPGGVRGSKGEFQVYGIQLGLHELLRVWNSGFKCCILLKLHKFKSNSLADRSPSTDNSVISSCCLLSESAGMNLWSVLLVLWHFPLLLSSEWKGLATLDKCPFLKFIFPKPRDHNDLILWEARLCESLRETKKAVSGRTVKRYQFFTTIIEPHN